MKKFILVKNNKNVRFLQCQRRNFWQWIVVPRETFLMLFLLLQISFDLLLLINKGRRIDKGRRLRGSTSEPRNLIWALLLVEAVNPIEKWKNYKSGKVQNIYTKNCEKSWYCILICIWEINQWSVVLLWIWFKVIRGVLMQMFHAFLLAGARYDV